MPCIFCEIVAGRAPYEKVFETDRVLAFMDVAPVVPGHVLVIPKQHVSALAGVGPEDLLESLLVAQRVARAFLGPLHADGVNLSQANGELAGQTVMHLHFHVIPRYSGSPHDWAQPAGSYPDPATMAEEAARIREALTAPFAEKGDLNV